MGDPPFGNLYGGLGHRRGSLVRTCRISSPTTSSVGSDTARVKDLGVPSLRWKLQRYTSGGFHDHGGTQNGRFLMENPNRLVANLGVLP